MKHLRSLSAPILAAVLGLGLSAGGGAEAAATKSKPKPAAAPAKPATPPAGRIDPEATAALNRMTAYMRSLKTFEIQSDTTIEQVVGDGLKLTFDGQNTYKVQRPTAFFIETKADRKVREFIYNGRTFTVYLPRQNFFATVSAPATIDEVLEDAYDKYGVSLPLADLFYWGTEGTPTYLVKSAYKVGYAKVGGVDTDQYAFRGQHVDFQVWITRGDRPLPRKIQITTTDDPAKPSYSAVLNWNTAPTFTADTFTFTPPTTAKPIRMAATPGQ